MSKTSDAQLGIQYDMGLRLCQEMPISSIKKYINHFKANKLTTDSKHTQIWYTLGKYLHAHDTLQKFNTGQT